MPEESQPPIKVVVPRDDVFGRLMNFGGSAKIFDDVTRNFRYDLQGQIETIRDYFRASFDEFPRVPAIARITLKRQALAKSHRPVELLSKASCRVVGVSALRELLIGVSPSNLGQLSSQIQYLSTVNGIANISTIDKIEPYTAMDALGGVRTASIVSQIHDGQGSFKLRLFQHQDQHLNEAIDDALRQRLREFGLLEAEQLRYSSRSRLLRIRGLTEETIQAIAQFVGTQSLSTFPIYSIRRATYQMEQYRKFD